MKIALTIDTFVEGQGGVSTAVAALARSLKQRDHQVMVFTAADPSHQGIDLDVVGFHALRYERFPGGRVPMAPIALTQELADFNPDVIHNHSMGTMGIQALAASRLLGIPIIGTCHILLSGFLKYAPLSLEGVPLTEEIAWKYTTTFFNRFPLVTTPSEVMRQELISHGLYMPLSTVSNGVDTTLFSPKNGHQITDSDPFTILHSGRLSYEKRVDLVLRAFARLSEIYPHIRLIIVGEGPEKSKLTTLANILGVEKQVDFAGFVPHDLLPSLYSEADVFATASTIETQGLVVLEAMACGLPIVGVNAMAIPELVKHKLNGFLVLPDDEIALVEALDRLLQDSRLRTAMGSASRKLALYHSLGVVVSAYERKYKKINRKQVRRLLPQMPKVPSSNEVRKSFIVEWQALKDGGVERAYELMATLQEWSGNVIVPVTEQVRNGFRSRASRKSGDDRVADPPKKGRVSQ